MTGVGNDGFVVGLPAIPPPPTCPGRVVGRLGIWGRDSPGVGAGFVAMPG
jgi:hypothetical protein